MSCLAIQLKRQRQKAAIIFQPTKVDIYCQDLALQPPKPPTDVFFQAPFELASTVKVFWLKLLEKNVP